MSDTPPHKQAGRLTHKVTSLAVDPKRLEQLWDLTPEERVAAAQSGRLALGEMLRWAARAPHEVPLVNGEFLFITALSADTEP